VDESFSVILWARAQELSRDQWIDRILGILREVAQLTDNAPFNGDLGNQDVAALAQRRDLIDRLIRQNVNREGRQVFEDLGSTFTVDCAFPPGDPPNFVTVRLCVAMTNPRFSNTCVVEFNPHLSARAARHFLQSAIPVWQPKFACVLSNRNQDMRMKEGEQPFVTPSGATGITGPIQKLDEELHWCTYFDEEETKRLDLPALQREPEVVVQRLAAGVLLVTGDPWHSAEALREQQRRLEPLLFSKARR
jgi:hypothetical protein